MPDLTTLTVGGQDLTGLSTLLESAADYAYQGRRLRARATGASAQRYFRPSDSVVPPYFRAVSETAGAGFSLVAPRSTLSFNQNAVFSSSPLYGLFGQPGAAAAAGDEVILGDAPSAAPSLALKHYESRAFATSMTYSRGLTPHTSVVAGGDANWIKTVGGGFEERDLNTLAVRAQLSHHLARDTSVTGGYYYRQGNISDKGPLGGDWQLPQHGVEVGLDYRHVLSKTRDFTVTSRFGASTMMLPQFNATGERISRRYNPFSGQVGFTYALNRTWRARAGYRRDVDYTPGVIEPISTQNVNAGFEGLVSRRIDVLGSAAYSNGQSTVNAGESVIKTVTTNTRVRFALTRVLATYVEYVYYFYDASGVALVPGLPATLDRKGIRAGAMLRLAAF